MHSFNSISLLFATSTFLLQTLSAPAPGHGAYPPYVVPREADTIPELVLKFDPYNTSNPQVTYSQIQPILVNAAQDLATHDPKAVVPVDGFEYQNLAEDLYFKISNPTRSPLNTFGVAIQAVTGYKKWASLHQKYYSTGVKVVEDDHAIAQIGLRVYTADSAIGF